MVSFPQLIVQIVKELRLADPEGWKNCHQFRDSTTILSDKLQTQKSLDQHTDVVFYKLPVIFHKLVGQDLQTCCHGFGL